MIVLEWKAILVGLEPQQLLEKLLFENFRPLMSTTSFLRGGSEELRREPEQKTKVDLMYKLVVSFIYHRD